MRVLKEAPRRRLCGAWDRLKFVADRVSGSNGLLVVSAADALLEDPLAQAACDRRTTYEQARDGTVADLGVPVVLGSRGATE